MHPLLERQKQLHEDATILLKETLSPLLSKYGKVEINGSYTYQLLYQPDLDFYVINEAVTKQMYVDMCRTLLALDSVAQFKSSDRVDFPHKHDTDRPTGYWLSPTIHTDDNAWTCDIWLQKPNWVDEKIYRYDDTLIHLSDEKKLIVLTLKEELIQSGRYGVGKDFESVDIYDAVLKNPALDIEGVRQELNKGK